MSAFILRVDAKHIAEAAADLAEIALKHKGRVEKLENAARDALAGWRYIRQQHGDLSGVGWDRVEQGLLAALGERA